MFKNFKEITFYKLRIPKENLLDFPVTKNVREVTMLEREDKNNEIMLLKIS